MLSSEVTSPAQSPKLAARFAALALGAVLLAGCQAQPLYGNLSGEARSVTVSKADSRIEQVVRNELVLGFGGEQPSADYTLEMTATSGIAGILPGGLDNEFSAARATVTAVYVLRATETGETVKSGTRIC
jgi:LPS-assembly lipoprotein